MDILDTKTNDELLQSLLSEVAKSNSEIRTAQADIDKAQRRIKFCVVLANKLIDRGERSDETNPTSR